MKQIREKNNSMFIDKFICLCNRLDIVDTQRVKEDLPYGMSIEKEVCTFEENDDFNLSEERMTIKKYENCNVYTNEDLFVLALSPQTNIYLYTQEDDLFVVDNLDIVGQHTFISEEEICSTNLVSPSFSMDHRNFYYFKEFVLKNKTTIEDFKIEYKNNCFAVAFNENIILQITNVSKRMVYPFVLYILSKIRTDDDFMENYHVVAGEVVN